MGSKIKMPLIWEILGLKSILEKFGKLCLWLVDPRVGLKILDGVGSSF